MALVGHGETFQVLLVLCGGLWQFDEGMGVVDAVEMLQLEKRRQGDLASLLSHPQ
jgi:hypothetical protein